MISFVVVAYNEREKLQGCLESVKDFVDEIIVVDLGSSDGTAEIAKKYKARVFLKERVLYADPIRNWAISKASCNWVLMLDPDERITESLAKELLRFLGSIESQRYSAINIPRKNIFFGQWITHTNFWADRQIRFFKKASVTWQERVHSYPRVEGEVLDLEAKEDFAMEHYGYKTRKEFIERQLKYAKIEALNRHSAGEGFSIFRLFWLPVREFLVRFVKHKGYKDGMNGFFLVLVLMFYHIKVEINMILLRVEKR